MRYEAASLEMAFLDEPEVLHRVCTRAQEGAFRTLVVGGTDIGKPRVLRRPGATSATSTVDHCEKSRFTSQQSRRSRKVKRESCNDSIRPGRERYFQIFSRGDGRRSLSVRRSHKERHALLTARSWAGALLATQRLACDAAAGEVVGEGIDVRHTSVCRTLA